MRVCACDVIPRAMQMPDSAGSGGSFSEARSPQKSEPAAPSFKMDDSKEPPVPPLFSTDLFVPPRLRKVDVLTAKERADALEQALSRAQQRLPIASTSGSLSVSPSLQFAARVLPASPTRMRRLL
jgi:hypothetical protein